MDETPPRRDYPAGWNDPPMLNYSSSNPPPKSRIGSKRIAFPVGVSTPSTELVDTSSSSSTAAVGCPCDKKLFLLASENFNKLLEHVESESVKNQIELMLTDWQAGKMSINVQNLLANLTNYIVQCDTAAINEIRLKLAMTPHEPLIKSYMKALNSLAETRKQKEQL